MNNGNWTSDELDALGTADELEIAGLRNDGTLRKYRTIWVVRVGNELFVRSVNGRGSDWFRGVATRYEGRVQAGGVEKDVTFVEVDDAALHQQIDSAYWAKYGHYPKAYVDACVTPQAWSATVRLVPRGEG